jgi:hypothetical protein
MLISGKLKEHLTMNEKLHDMNMKCVNMGDSS